MLKIKPIAKVFYLAGSLLLPMTVHADYAAQIIDPSSGYVLKVDNNSTVDPTPYKGSDGQNYYQVGDPITLDSTSAQASGMVKCVGRRWGGTVHKFYPPIRFIDYLCMSQPLAFPLVEKRLTALTVT